MTATGPAASAHPPRATVSARRGQARDLARAGAAPLVCGLILMVMLATWVIGGGGGAVSRVRIRVTQATVPMLSFTGHATTGRRAPVYLTLRNLSGNEDVLLSASSPDAARVELTAGTAAAGSLSGLAVGAGATVSLSPFGRDLVLVDPKRLADGQDVLLRLRFRHAGVIAVEATVTPPGTP